MDKSSFEWAENAQAAITVCDENAIIIFMNKRARQVFSGRGGNLIGNSLYDCHNPKSSEKIRELLKEGTTNNYTISKNGIKKMIHQQAWFKEDGSVGGLTEISFEIPQEMPHFVRS
ncbi:MAG: PAS domain-containing protein [Sphingobacteriia bacterium]|nr:PAS domain-containing protein [Sphingobacteriia bacterium]